MTQLKLRSLFLYPLEYPLEYLDRTISEKEIGQKAGLGGPLTAIY
jgi:hypothetical protein